MYVTKENIIYYARTEQTSKWVLLSKQLLLCVGLDPARWEDTLCPLLEKPDDDFKHYCELKNYSLDEFEEEFQQGIKQETLMAETDDAEEPDDDMEDTEMGEEESSGKNVDANDAPEAPTSIANGKTPPLNHSSPSSARSQGGTQHTPASTTDASSSRQTGISYGSEQHNIAASPEPQRKKPIRNAEDEPGILLQYDKDVPAEARLIVDLRGMEIVMKYEKQQGRTPTDMSSDGSLGYDITSVDPKTQRTRYIEVKSCGKEWKNNNVAMRNGQLRKAVECQAEYFLYVVEYVFDPERTVIYEIQNPASQLPPLFLGDSFKESEFTKKVPFNPSAL